MALSEEVPEREKETASRWRADYLSQASPTNSRIEMALSPVIEKPSIPLSEERKKIMMKIPKISEELVFH